MYSVLFVMYLDKILDGISHFSTVKLCLDVEIQCRYKRLLWVSCVDECVSLYNYCAGSGAFKNVEMCIKGRCNRWQYILTVGRGYCQIF